MSSENQSESGLHPLDELGPDARKVGDSLRRAADQNLLVSPVRDCLERPTASLASAIQAFNVECWVAAGRRLIGSKVGITTPDAQKQFGVDSPVFGWLFADMLGACGVNIDSETVPQLRVEAEIAFVLKSDIDVPEPTLPDVIRAIEFALPAIELVSSRIRDWDVSHFDLVADNVAASKVVLGETPFTDFSADLRDYTATTVINGESHYSGSRGAYRGSPLQSLIWLSTARMSAGKPLRRGELVLTGCIGPIVPAGRGDAIEVAIGNLPSVRTVIQ